MSDLESFKDYKKLVRLSPFLVATYMGQADEIHLEEEKVIELAHFEEFSLHSEEFTASAEIFLDLENEDFHEIWELNQSEILTLLQDLPKASMIVLGVDSHHLSEMLERVALQVARADGHVHDLEIAAASELEPILGDLTSITESMKEGVSEIPYEVKESVEEDSQSQYLEDNK